MNDRYVSFEAWYTKVGLHVQKLAGLSVDDLPDCPYADWWEDDMPALSAARKAIRMASE